MHRLHSLIKHLPYDAALWRDQGRRELPELFHEWMQTLIKFGAGEKVRPPATVRDESTIRTTKPSEISAFFAEHIG